MSATLRRPDRARPRRSGRRPLLSGPLLFLVPAVLLFGAFLLYPMMQTVVMSFFSWNGFITSEPEFVGTDNYRRIFTADPVFWRAFANTSIWVVLSLIVPTVLGLLLALALNRRMIGRGTFRTIFYLPGVLASIAVASIWVWLYNTRLGLIAQIFETLGIRDLMPNWLGDQDLALYSVFVAFVWQSVGFTMVLFLAGLQNVPKELEEAARVDGASKWQSFRAVTLPALRPTTVVVIVLTLISSLKVFDLIVGMTGGGPAQSTQVLALWSYTQSFFNRVFGLGNAIATILFALTLLLVVPYMVWTMKGEKR